MVSCWSSMCSSVRKLYMYMSIFLFLDYNLSKYLLIFIKFGMHIHIVRSILGLLMGKFKVSCPSHNKSEVLFHILFSVDFRKSIPS